MNLEEFKNKVLMYIISNDFLCETYNNVRYELNDEDLINAINNNYTVEEFVYQLMF